MGTVFSQTCAYLLVAYTAKTTLSDYYEVSLVLGEAFFNRRYVTTIHSKISRTQFIVKFSQKVASKNMRRSASKNLAIWFTPKRQHAHIKIRGGSLFPTRHVASAWTHTSTKRTTLVILQNNNQPEELC